MEKLRGVLSCKGLEKHHKKLQKPTLSFGRTEIIEFSIDCRHLKSVKGRPPTSTVSLKTLARVSLKTSFSEQPLSTEFPSEELYQLTTTQKALLEQNCRLLRKLLTALVEQRCLAVMDNSIQVVSKALRRANRDALAATLVATVVRLPPDVPDCAKNIKSATDVLTSEVLLLTLDKKKN